MLVVAISEHFGVSWSLTSLFSTNMAISETMSTLENAVVFKGALQMFRFTSLLSTLSGFDFVFGRPFVKRFTQCYRSVVCLSVLSVTLVYCGQMVGWIKMKLGVQVGLGPGHIVLDGDPAPPPPKGGADPPIFRPISVVAKWLDGSGCNLVWRKDSAHATLC